LSESFLSAEVNVYSFEEALGIVAPNIDPQGLIENINEEWGGGDTAQREGMWAYGLALAFPDRVDSLRAKFSLIAEKLSVGPGIYIRHTGPGPWWYTDPKDLSRDQTIPLVAAFGRLQAKGQLIDIATRTLERFGCAQNGDPWWWPYYWAFWVRAFVDAKLMPEFVIRWNPLTWFCDAWLVLASLWAVLDGDVDPDHSDDLNFTLILLQSNTASTPLAHMARWIFARWRPALKGTEEPWGPASALEAYFAGPYGKSIGAPRIDLLYNKSGILKTGLSR
jgi:hypothetical protein